VDTRYLSLIIVLPPALQLSIFIAKGRYGSNGIDDCEQMFKTETLFDFFYYCVTIFRIKGN